MLLSLVCDLAAFHCIFASTILSFFLVKEHNSKCVRRGREEGRVKTSSGAATMLSANSDAGALVAEAATGAGALALLMLFMLMLLLLLLLILMMLLSL